MTLTCNVSASDHIRGVISDCTQTQYALRVPRSHGLNTAGLQTHLPTCSCVSKHVSTEWSGFTMTADRQRVNAFLRRSKRYGSCPPDLMTFEQLLEAADQQLFNNSSSQSVTSPINSVITLPTAPEITQQTHTSKNCRGASQTYIFLHASYIKTRTE